MKLAVMFVCIGLTASLCWSADRPKHDCRPSPAPTTESNPTLTPAASAQSGKHVLTDQEMDDIAAGGVAAQMNGNLLSFAGQTANGNVSGSGTMEVKSVGQNAISGVLLMQDSAQSGSKSFIGINAVNSEIQVLVNLNININSTVGNLHQGNLSGK